MPQAGATVSLRNASNSFCDVTGPWAVRVFNASQNLCRRWSPSVDNEYTGVSTDKAARPRRRATTS
ncbi:hypothetical protein IG631_02045 [Alternaria alternata]|nr:hypothetical protein IG631_02045 [Alternaria alternata]